MHSTCEQAQLVYEQARRYYYEGNYESCIRLCQQTLDLNDNDDVRFFLDNIMEGLRDQPDFCLSCLRWESNCSCRDSITSFVQAVCGSTFSLYQHHFCPFLRQVYCWWDSYLDFHLQKLRIRYYPVWYFKTIINVILSLFLFRYFFKRAPFSILFPFIRHFSQLSHLFTPALMFFQLIRIFSK